MATSELTQDLLIKEDNVEEICAIWATNRQVLVDYLRQMVVVERPDAPYLQVELFGEKLGCKGGSVVFKTEADIPEHSVPCPCGNPKHWLIKYGG